MTHTPITIFGSGAIGGTIGAQMQRAGHDVQFVDQALDHVHAINQHGLKISGFENFTVFAKALTPDKLLAPLGLVFLAVKSQDTDTALTVIEPLCGPETVIVSLQNGMNPPRIAQRLGSKHVVAGFVSFPADWQSPGHIEQGGVGNIWLGELDGRITERLTHIKSLLDHAVTGHITDNIFGYLWSKQIDCSILFAQAVTNGTFAEIFAHPDYQRLLIALLGEGVGIARAAGIELRQFGEFNPNKMRPTNSQEELEARDVLNRFAAVCAKQIKVRSGQWRDLAVRKRPTEVDHMLGWLIEQGQKFNLPVTLNQHLAAQVKGIEQGTRTHSLKNLDELEQLRQQLYGPGIGPV